MRFKGTYLLAFFFLVAAAYVYFYEVKGGEERKKAEEAEKRVFQFERENLTWVNLKNYENTFRVIRGPSGWEFVEPIVTKSDDNQIALILTSLENAEIERIVVDSTLDLVPYGLDEPQVFLQVGTDSTTYDTLYLGHHNPTLSFVYAKLSGESRIFLLPATLYNNANKQFFALRDKTVLFFDRDKVRRMILTRKDDTLVFEREGEKWWIKEPISVRGDHAKIARVVNTLNNMKAKEIVSEGGEDPAKFGFDNPWGRIDLFTEASPEMKSLILGKAKSNGDVYVKDISRETVFVVPPTVVTLIKDNVELFRDKKLLDFERDAVAEIGLVYPERLIRCERDTAGDWFVFTGDEPIRQPGNSARVSRLLSDLNGLTVEEFVSVRGTSLEPYGMDKPQVVIELVDSMGESLTLMVGKKGVEDIDGEVKEYLYAMNDRDGWICTVGVDVLDKLILDVEELREEGEEELVEGENRGE
jgi:hypothetical protein